MAAESGSYRRTDLAVVDEASPPVPNGTLEDFTKYLEGATTWVGCGKAKTSEVRRTADGLHVIKKVTEAKEADVFAREVFWLKKLDAEPEGTSGRKSGYGAILFGLLGLRDITLQSCFFEGSGSNSGDESIEEWAALVAEVQPRAVQIVAG